MHRGKIKRTENKQKETRNSNDKRKKTNDETFKQKIFTGQQNTQFSDHLMFKQA